MCVELYLHPPYASTMCMVKNLVFAFYPSTEFLDKKGPDTNFSHVKGKISELLPEPP
jgi:hypothetical protein